MMMSAAKEALGKLPALRLWRWALLLLVVTLVVQVRAMHLDDRLYFWIKTSWHQESWKPRSLWLPKYHVTIAAKAVPGVTQNFSGLSYDDDREQIWAVVNKPEQLLRLSPEGELLGRYPLSGFEDVEGVTYLGDGILLLAEERQHALVAVAVPERPGPL